MARRLLELKKREKVRDIPSFPSFAFPSLRLTLYLMDSHKAFWGVRIEQQFPGVGCGVAATGSSLYISWCLNRVNLFLVKKLK